MSGKVYVCGCVVGARFGKGGGAVGATVVEGLVGVRVGTPALLW